MIQTLIHSLLLFIFSSGLIAAQEIHFDRKERFGKLPRYRTCQTAFKATKAPPPSRDGLDTLQASASGQPTEKELLWIRNQIDPKYKLILVDLRAEPHGYLNGEPVLWDAEAREPLPELSKEILRIEDRSKKRHEVQPATFITEKTLAKNHGIDAILFPTRHAQEPPEQTVNAFIAFVDAGPKDSWIHLHCREGWSRTTLYFAMLDMLKNADKASFKTIMRRQHLIGGADMAAEPELSIQFNFLERFYSYTKLHKNGYRGNWSDYCKAHPPQKTDYFLRAFEGPLEEFEQQSFPEILRREFYYQAQGCSTVAFRSADEQFILKLFKLRDAQTGREILKRFRGYQIAMERNRENTGMIYYHLHQSDHLNTHPQLFEKVVHNEEISFVPLPAIDLNERVFVIQKKAKNLGNLITQDIRRGKINKLRKHLRGIFSLYTQEFQEGFWDIDPKLIYNTGYVDDVPIRYDVSHLREVKELEPEFFAKFKQNVIKHFVLWIQRKNFEDTPEILEELLSWLSSDPLKYPHAKSGKNLQVVR